LSDVLNLLCAGAAQGLVKSLQPRFERETGVVLQARFGAVGVMKEALLGGDPCDVMVVTDAMVVALQAAGALDAQRRAPLGSVRTGVAVRRGEPLPEIASPQALKASLLAASAVYFPDPQRATAGIHFASVLEQLGIKDALAPRLRTFPNGATSMRELAVAAPGAIGCTQITEILYTPGIALVGALPAAFELATVYSAAVAARAAHPALAQRLVQLLAGPGSRALRAESGFEFDPADETG
jgi:molybdate transport system substrate-binding protein